MSQGQVAGVEAHLKVIAVTDVLLVDPDLWDRGAVFVKSGRRLPHLRHVDFLDTRANRRTYVVGISATVSLHIVLKCVS